MNNQAHIPAAIIVAVGLSIAGISISIATSRRSRVSSAMIAEATAAAREAAEQFAADADSELGDIRRANQGVFVILPRDPAPDVQEANQLNKTVPVVATIDYYLK